MEPAPLLKEERDTGFTAPIAKTTYPLSIDRAMTGPRLAARNEPIHASEVEVLERSEKWLG